MRVTRPGAAVQWILLALVSSVNLAAQSGTQPSLDQRQYAGWVFTPSISVGGGWDDNVLLAQEVALLRARLDVIEAAEPRDATPTTPVERQAG